MPTPISMVATMTSFHVPYACWPPSGVITNENHYSCEWKSDYLLCVFKIVAHMQAKLFMMTFSL
jgi:hypothetical protein